MTLNSRKTRLSVAWVVAWAIGIHVDNGGRWDNDDFVLFVALGLAPVAIYLGLLLGYYKVKK